MLALDVVDADTLDAAVEAAAADDKILDATSGLIVRVSEGRVAVEPGGGKMTVTVTIPFPEAFLVDDSPLSFPDWSLESVPFEEVSDASPPFAPVAAIRDKAFASLVHAITWYDNFSFNVYRA